MAGNCYPAVILHLVLLEGLLVMAFSVETQVKAKETYAWLVCSLAEVGALFSTGNFAQTAVLELAAFDASATSVESDAWVEAYARAGELSSAYAGLRDLVASFASGWAERVAEGDEARALEFLRDVNSSVAYARESVFG